MEEENIKQLYALLDSIPSTKGNKKKIDEIKDLIKKGNFSSALDKIEKLNDIDLEEPEENEPKTKKQNVVVQENEDETNKYPKELSNIDLEKIYIGMLLCDPKLIVRYYFTYDEARFEDQDMLNLYKVVLFTDGAAYSSEKAKDKFNFANDTEESYKLKIKLKNEIAEKNNEQEIDMEKVYIELKKLFILRKNYLEIPIYTIQQKILEIVNYELYDKMSEEEVQNAISQITITDRFKQSVLNKNLSKFLEEGDNNLTNGLDLPFPILSSVFKGIRKGETMAISMPSNSGKSRFTVNVAAYTALVHRKKVLIISNEMSEEKTRLCLITTIINHPEIQKIHGHKITKSEGELLEFKFRPDTTKDVEVDEDGFVLKRKGETQKEFVKRLLKISTEFNEIIKITDWANKEINNSIYFINITDHTNEELKNVIMNYYYKEKIEYIFYDTLKTDIDNIGNGEELKRTATILSNLAQNFEIFICSSLQLTESSTDPINLSINDLAGTRTVKEVLDGLCLIKQITRENFDKYEYSLEEVDTKFYDLEKFDDPDVRYYACVVDKNRAGAKPKVLFRLNLAYNRWEELGYLRLKQ